MRSLNLLRQLSCLLIVLCCMQEAYSYAQSNVSALYRVKKIYIQSYPNVKEGMKVESFLKAELEKRGFEIVNDASNADAILSGEVQAEIVLDGDGNIPAKSIYLYQLTLPNREIVWKGKIKFVSKQTVAEDNEYAARKIAKKNS
jgi:hypothetical protein